MTTSFPAVFEEARKSGAIPRIRCSIFIYLQIMYFYVSVYFNSIITRDLLRTLSTPDTVIVRGIF